MTPQEFFDEGNTCPEKLRELTEQARKLDDTALTYIIGIMRELNNKK
mgnify:FL=1